MLIDQLNNEMKEAMLAHDSVRLSVVRNIKAAITNELVASNRTPQDKLSDEEILSVIARLAKQRRDSIEQFEKGGRSDLAESESAELDILANYLPKMMSAEDVKIIVEKRKTELGITDKSQAGRLMAELMKELKGKAEGDTVRKIVEELF